MRNPVKYLIVTGIAILVILFLSFSFRELQIRANIESTARVLQNQATPDFVLTPGGNSQDSSRVACTTISQEHLWQSGDDAFKMTESIEKTLSASIDDVPIEKSQISIEQWNAIQWVSKDRKVLGSYGDWIGVCLRTNNLFSGLHSATIRFTSEPGPERTYKWAFGIP